jgi:uncharacterized protein YaeQ
VGPTMALTATMYHWQAELADVDRGVYAPIDLRLAQHPSESMRYMLTRALAYCLCFTEGIAFSKAGIASTDDPPISVRDPTGLLLEWIDVGAPSAERLHRATKAARSSVAVLAHAAGPAAARGGSRRSTRSRRSRCGGSSPAFLDALADRLGRNSKVELTRTDGCSM